MGASEGGSGRRSIILEALTDMDGRWRVDLFTKMRCCFSFVVSRDLLYI